MFKRLSIFLILTIFLMGFVSAQEVSDFKFNSDFKDVGDGVFIKYGPTGQAEQSMAVVPFSKSGGEDYFKNDTNYGYSVNKSKNQTYNFVDEPLKEQGTCEIIKVDNKYFIVESWEKIGAESSFEDTFNNVMEFNKLNNVKPSVVSDVVK